MRICAQVVHAFGFCSSDAAAFALFFRALFGFAAGGAEGFPANPAGGARASGFSAAAARMTGAVCVCEDGADGGTATGAGAAEPGNAGFAAWPFTAGADEPERGACEGAFGGAGETE